MSEQGLKIRAVKLSRDSVIYVEGRGRKSDFCVAGSSYPLGFQEVYSIERVSGGVIIVSDLMLDKISRIAEIPDSRIIGIYYEDE